FSRDWSSDVCSSDLQEVRLPRVNGIRVRVTPLSHEGKNLAGLNQLVDIVVLIIERQRPGELRNASTDRPLLERAAAHVIPLTIKLVSHRQRERTSIADGDLTNRDSQLRPAIHELSIRVGRRGQRKPTSNVVEVVLLALRKLVTEVHAERSNQLAAVA